MIRLQGAEQDDLGDATDWERVEALSDDDKVRSVGTSIEPSRAMAPLAIIEG